ncbi:metal-sulfur cluster assembly factor [Ramlibacter tataouinensis]|uniref:Hydroxylase n=1 Tax=Ramlibacter tataouinensis TaxID=94132 RepID=A0A127JVX2_9BURK|nr:metal-sulfur cluster assembly factor [Ramlibacter tataouinensis]AMO24029.1 hydroxylase [Ramlibacter tataouinensis]
MSEERFEWEGPDELLPVVTDALERVVDPEVALNIVDVGLVYLVTVQDKRLDVHVTMTSAACPVADVIVSDIETELDRALPEDMLIHVELVWEPPWTPQRMSDKARLFMGW